jgi:Lrp/AsnC family leucine-responsive transcriptional regulator
MDREDLLILSELEKDCRQSLRELSHKTGQPMSTVHARIKKLEKAGVIKAYSAFLDAEKLGKSTTAFIQVALRGGDPTGKRLTQRQIAIQLASNPYVHEVYIITGEYDILLKVRAPDLKSVGAFIIDQIREIPGVDKTNTFYSFEAIKERGAVVVL